MKEEGFDIIFSSDIQYNELCAEIYYNREYVGMITQEQGIENANIEIIPPKNGSLWQFNYIEFMEILKESYQLLKKKKKLT